MYRQHRLTRGVWLVVVTAALVGAPTAAAAAMPVERLDHISLAAGGCSMSLLPVPTGVERSWVTGGDHTGKYLVGQGERFDGTQWTFDGLVWVSGEVSTLSTDALAPSAQVNLTDVNGQGVVVGFRYTDFSSFHTDAWANRDGYFTMLPGLKPADATRAVAINVRGDIVGTSEDHSVSPAVFHAVIWRADDLGRARELTVDGQSPPWATGVDIDDDGTVLGLLGPSPDQEQRPYIWPAQGNGYPLTAPPGTDMPLAVSIHEGWVAGTAMHDSDIPGMRKSSVARWDLRTGTATLISTEYGSASAVNRQGTVATVGALIHRDGRVRVLGGDATVSVLSDRGTAAGSDTFYGGNAATWIGC